VNEVNKKLIAVLVIVLLLPLIACNQAAVVGVLKSDKERITSPDAGLSEQALLVEGNSAFAFELYQALKGEEVNLFYSPYSI
jgi:serine protease inhibitor